MGEQWKLTSQYDLNMMNQSLSSRLESGPLQISVKRWKESRTLDQNSVLHIWFREIAKQWKDHGWTNETAYKDDFVVKEYFKHKFLPTVPIKVSNKVELPPIPKPTSLLDTGEMTSFMMQIEAWCTDRGYWLSKPEDSEYMKILSEMGEAI